MCFGTVPVLASCRIVPSLCPSLYRFSSTTLGDTLDSTFFFLFPLLSALWCNDEICLFISWCNAPLVAVVRGGWRLYWAASMRLLSICINRIVAKGYIHLLWISAAPFIFVLFRSYSSILRHHRSHRRVRCICAQIVMQLKLSLHQATALGFTINAMPIITMLHTFPTYGLWIIQ